MRAHKYVPWRDVLSWRCIRCGKCCRIFSVPLTLAEALNIARKYGPFVVSRNNKLVLISKPNGDCIFLERYGNIAYCTIYPERPFVCRIYPFYVKLSPLKSGSSSKEALYVCDDGFEVYVYLDALCEGIDRGGYPVKGLVSKVVSLWRRHMGV